MSNSRRKSSDSSGKTISSSNTSSSSSRSIMQNLQDDKRNSPSLTASPAKEITPSNAPKKERCNPCQYLTEGFAQLGLLLSNILAPAYPNPRATNEHSNPAASNQTPEGKDDHNEKVRVVYSLF